MLIPLKALTKLVCSFCRNYLSVFPIHYENEQKTYICGRCPLITSLNPIRQVAYEELAKFIKFPCKYQESGCLECYMPYDLRKHEDLCKYRPYFCPILPLGDCPWQGQHDELYEHFSDNHKLYVLNDLELEVDLVSNYEEHYIFFYESNTFIVYLKCNIDRDEFCCCVKYFSPTEDDQSYTYKVNLHDNHGLNYEFDARPVQPNANGTVDRAKATYVDICNIKLKLNNPNYVLLNIQMLRSNNNEAECASLSKFEEDMLRNIECPVCMEYMTPPILQCTTGHSICEKCRVGKIECPTCRGPIGNTRNFSLEEFTKFIKYPCKYREYSCTYTSNSSDIREHEVECKFGPFTCPIQGCTWKNKLSNLLQHIKAIHVDNFLDMDVVAAIFTPGINDDATYITSAYDDLFKLYFRYENNIFFWAMQTIGALESNIKYMFELDIFNDESSERVFARKTCSPLTVNDDALNDSRSYIELSEKVLRNMIVDDALNYTFRILKEEI